MIFRYLAFFILSFCLISISNGQKSIDSPSEKSTIEICESQINVKKSCLDTCTDIYQKASLHADIGHLQDYIGNYQAAIDEYYLAIVLYDRAMGVPFEFGYSRPWLLVDMGNVLYKMKDFESAIEMYIYTYSIFEEYSFIRYDKGLITCLNNIGLCNANNPMKALPYHLAALRLCDNGAKHLEGALTNIYLGASYNLVGKHEKAKQCLKQSISYFSSVNDTARLIYGENELARVFLTIHEFDSTTVHLNHVRRLLNGRMNNPSYASMLITEAKLLYNQDRFDAALDTVMKYLKSNERIKITSSNAILVNHDTINSTCNNEFVLDKKTKYELTEIAYLCYKSKSQLAEALYMHEQMLALKDTIESINHQNKIKTIEFRIKSYSFREKILFLEEENKNEEIRSSYERRLSVLLVIAEFVILLIILFDRKRISYREHMILDFVNSFNNSQKMLIFLSYIVYNVIFFYLFQPLINPEMPGNLTLSVFPGLVLSSGIAFAGVLSWIKKKLKSRISNSSQNSFILFSLVSSVIFMLLFYSFAISSPVNIPKLLSVVFLVFASFIIPFSIVVLILENVILKTIEKNVKVINKDLNEITKSNNPIKKIIINSPKSSGSLSINSDSLIAIRSTGNYCIFFYLENKINKHSMLLIPIKNVEAILKDYPEFFRCHHSFIINIRFIQKVMGKSREYQIKAQGVDEAILVSRSKQEEFKNKIKELANM